MSQGFSVLNAIGSYQNIDETSTTQNHPLGYRVQARNESTGFVGEYVYLKGVASTAIGGWVVFYPDDFTTALLDSSGSPKQSVAIAMSANVASQYGWYQVWGKASGLALASFADNGDVYATTTPGSVDDAVVDGYLVHCARGASTITGAGLAEFEIQYPYVDGIASND